MQVVKVGPGSDETVSRVQNFLGRGCTLLLIHDVPLKTKKEVRNLLNRQYILVTPFSSIDTLRMMASLNPLRVAFMDLKDDTFIVSEIVDYIQEVSRIEFQTVIVFCSGEVAKHF